MGNGILTTKILQPFLIGGKRRKVSDLYRVPGRGREGCALKVTGNNISAFDVTIGDINGKGKENEKISNHWKKSFVGIVDNDIANTDEEEIAACYNCKHLSNSLDGRVSLIRLAEVIPIEAIVRGAIAGSAWDRYKIQNESGCCFYGHWLLPGMKESEVFEVPIFTPTTKETEGHDEPLYYNEMVHVISRWLKKHGEITGHTGESLAQAIRSTSIALYSTAFNIALKKGIIIADTKFEFGLIRDCNVWNLVLIDEVLTPDSSRFWPLKTYEPGKSQPSLDKQYFRDWLTKEAKWDKVSSPPKIPTNVKKETLRRYQEIAGILTS